MDSMERMKRMDKGQSKRPMAVNAQDEERSRVESNGEILRKAEIGVQRNGSLYCAECGRRER